MKKGLRNNVSIVGQRRNENTLRRNDTPIMIAVGGMSGSGKTTLAAKLAEKLPGSVFLDSDVTFKKMLGVPPETPLPADAYSPQNIAKFIKHIQDEASGLLRKGRTVVVTGTFLGQDERRNQQQVAARAGAEFIGIYLDAPLKVLYDRVAKRENSASDADQEVVRRQIRKSVSGQQGLHWYIVNSARPQAEVERDAVRLVVRELHRYRFRNQQSGPKPK